MPGKILTAILAFLLLAAPVAAGPAVQPLEIVTASGAHKFEVEAAQTTAEREKGLMFRRSMPHNHGMIFDFRQDQLVLMWMKDTYIPLDMIFVSRDGKVVSIAENATPMSETVISSQHPVYAVIELNAGVGKEIGVAPGDIVRHSLFKR